MSTDKKIKLIGTMVGIICFIALMAGITYAWITWSSSNVGIAGNADCFPEITSGVGQSLTNESVILFDERTILKNGKITIKNGMAMTNVTAYRDSSCDMPVSIELILNVTSLNSAFISGDSVGAFKYVIASYDPSVYSDITVSALNGVEFDVINKGVVTNTGEEVILNEPLSTTNQGYLIIFYIDGDLAGNGAAGSSNFVASVNGFASQYETATLSDYITSLYLSGKPTKITQTGSNYSYYNSYQDKDKTWGLMNDGLKVDNTLDATTTGLATTITDENSLKAGTEGNLRYFGDNPNNYIYFNCSNYSMLNDNNCEKWRIIGIVDGKVKIIRDESIASIAWDLERIEGFGYYYESYNNWGESSLKIMLNNLYYYGNTSGFTDYLSGSSGGTVTRLNFLEIGIKNDIARQMISESTWYLGGNSSSSVYATDIYINERQNIPGTTILSGNSFTINANVGLMSASDYGFATDLSVCDHILNVYALCTANNWLYSGTNQWLITPNATDANNVFGVSRDGNVATGYVYAGAAVRPVLYLNADVSVLLGHKGTSDDPYRIFYE